MLRKSYKIYVIQQVYRFCWMFLEEQQKKVMEIYFFFRHNSNGVLQISDVSEEKNDQIGICFFTQRCTIWSYRWHTRRDSNPRPAA